MFYASQMAGAIDTPMATVTDDKTGPSVTTFSAKGESANVTIMAGVPETVDEGYFNTMKHYKKESRYFSMVCDYSGNVIAKGSGAYVVAGGLESPVVVNGKRETLGQERFFYSVNVLAALADPDVWPGRDAAKKRLWNGEAYNPIDPAESKDPVARDFRQKLQSFKDIASDYSSSLDLPSRIFRDIDIHSRLLTIWLLATDIAL